MRDCPRNDLTYLDYSQSSPSPSMAQLIARGIGYRREKGTQSNGSPSHTSVGLSSAVTGTSSPLQNSQRGLGPLSPVSCSKECIRDILQHAIDISSDDEEEATSATSSQ